LDLGTERVVDESGQIDVRIEAVERPSSEVELAFELVALGTEEMDKLVLEVVLDEMILVEGAGQWDGFVPPRQPQKHRVVVKPLEDATEPTVRINVSRFRDSRLLMQRVVRFSPQGDLVGLRGAVAARSRHASHRARAVAIEG